MLYRADKYCKIGETYILVHGVKTQTSLYMYSVSIDDGTWFSVFYLDPKYPEQYLTIKALIDNNAPLGVLADAIDEDENIDGIIAGREKSWMTSKLRLENLVQVK